MFEKYLPGWMAGGLAVILAAVCSIYVLTLLAYLVIGPFHLAWAGMYIYVGDAQKPLQILAGALFLLALANTKAFDAAQRMALGKNQPAVEGGQGTASKDYHFSAKWDFLTAGLFYSTLAIAITWPLAAQLGQRLPDEGDPLLNAWILWRMGENLLGRGDGLYGGNIFFPAQDPMTYSETMIAGAVTALPLLLAGATPVMAANALLILAFAANGLGAYLLALRMTGVRPAALLAGVVFGFSMPRMDQMEHLQMACSHFIPLAALCWIRFLDKPGAARAWAFAGFAALAALSNMHYAVYTFYLFVLWALWDLRFGSGGWGVKARALALPALAAGGALAWIFLPYLRSGHSRLMAETLSYANSPFSFLNPSPHGALWGWAAVKQTGGYWFPGAAAMAAALAGAMAVVMGKTEGRGAPAALLTMGALAAWASLGPDWGLYGFMFDHLPGFSGVRNINRIAIVWLLAAGVFAAIGAAAAMARLGPAGRGALAAAVIAIALAESYSPRMDVYIHSEDESRRFAWLAQRPEVRVILILPMDPMETQATYASIYHGKKMVNGYSGFFPPFYLELQERQDSFPSPWWIDSLRQAGVDHVVVDAAHVDYRKLTGMMERFQDFTFVEKKEDLALFRVLP